jgi:hypothetical protein
VLLENEGNVSNDAIKFALFKMICHPTKRFQLYIRATTSLLHALLHFDHTAVPIAHLMERFVVDYDCPKIVGDLCRYAPQRIGRRLFLCV